jgi:rhodanese-related sulfurtransferase
VQEFIQFFAHHWLLSGLLVILLILLMIEEARSKGLLDQLSPQETVQKLNHESAVIIDIRNRESFQGGHIVGAVNLPQTELAKDLSKLNKYKDRPLIIVCLTGQGAGKLVLQLKKQSFDKVFALAGGIGAWKRAEMPMVKK